MHTHPQRFLYVMFAFAVVFALFNSTPAYAQESLTAAPVFQELADKGSYASDERFFSDLRALLLRCAVQPYAVSPNGNRVNGNLRSVCKELEIFANAAKFEMN